MSAAEPEIARLDPAAAASVRDEFRDVTVLFGDVSGFTSMSERLDPEDVHQIMNACFDGLGVIIRDHAGHIDKYIGDCIMALFGAPVAHEDDPVRAAETALAMQRFLRSFAKQHRDRVGVELRMRIGIHCGRVVAGKIGGEVRRDYSVIGDVVNVASRLESQARPGTILVSGDVVRRTGALFRFGAVRHLKVKGRVKPVAAYELHTKANPFAAQHGVDAEIPLIGRDADIRKLRRLWSRADESDANSETHSAASPTPRRWVEVLGPMGVGKSRLVYTAAERDHSVHMLQVIARPVMRNRPFALARLLLQNMLQDLDESAHQIRHRTDFETALGSIVGPLEPYLNALWYLAAPESESIACPDPDPEAFRRTLEHGFATLLAGLGAHDESLVIFLDSYDHADTATCELLEGIFTGDTQQLPTIVTASRTRASNSEVDAAVLTLAPLDSAAADRLLQTLVHRVKLPEKLRADLHKRAEGIPLYLEELVRKLVDEGLLVESAGEGTWVCDPAATTAILPGSLMGAMIARLDRLEENERELLCLCSTQGVEFDEAAAELMWNQRKLRGPSIVDCLLSLQKRGIIVPGETDPRHWSFRHVVMQNACYESMLSRHRRDLHEETAKALIAHAGGAEAVSPEILAHHFENGECWQAAAQANLRAGDRAAELFANADALERYSRAIEAAQRETEMSPDNDKTNLLAHRGASRVHLHVGDYFALERHAGLMGDLAEETADRAEALRLVAAGLLQTSGSNNAEVKLKEALDIVISSSEEDHPDQAADITRAHFAIRYDLADLCHRAGRHHDALEHIDQCRQCADAGSPEALRVDLLEGRIAHTQGRFANAVSLYERAFQAARSLGSLSELALSSNNMGNAARDVGNYDDAERHFAHALAIWERTGNTECVAGAHNNLANLAISRGKARLARRHYKLALQAFNKIGNMAGKALARTNLAILAIETGDFQLAVRQAEKACNSLRGTGNRVLRGLSMVVYGEALLEIGGTREAGTAFYWVLAEYNEKVHPLAVAGATRGLGRLALMTGELRKAKDQLNAALAIYERLEREQEAARTQLYIARTHLHAGRQAEAQNAVAQARERFRKIGADQDLARADEMADEIDGLEEKVPLSRPTLTGKKPTAAYKVDRVKKLAVCSTTNRRKKQSNSQ
ncbi:MAG: adenylate/guanylate cyclase domain-containing protein [Hyphomicrobiaceae bacterium]